MEKKGVTLTRAESGYYSRAAPPQAQLFQSRRWHCCQGCSSHCKCEERSESELRGARCAAVWLETAANCDDGTGLGRSALGGSSGDNVCAKEERSGRGTSKTRKGGREQKKNRPQVHVRGARKNTLPDVRQTAPHSREESQAPVFS